MNCQDFEIIVRDMARAQAHNRRADTNEYLQALSHVDACEICALRLQDECGLSRGLDAVATELSRYEPSRHLEEKLLQSYRETFSPAACSQSMRPASQSRTFGRQTYWLAAAAAVVLTVIGVAVLRSRMIPLSPSEAGARPILESAPRQNSTPLTAGKTGSKPAGPTPPAISRLKNDDRVARAPLPKRIRKLAPRPVTEDGGSKLQTSATKRTTTGTRQTEQPETAQAETEIATQFMALSFLRPANLQDGGQIVRIELSRSAMASFGLPVNMDRFGERVKADVLVSADGFARAIRFVQ